MYHIYSKCVPLLLHLLYSVHCVRFYNPPTLPPDVFKVSEKHDKLVLEKLEGKEARDLIRDANRGGLEDRLSVLQDIKERRIDDKFKDVFNDISYRAPIKNLLNKYNNNKDLKRVLVKRIVPHGSISPKYEKDYNFRTLYRPLAIVHISLINGTPGISMTSQNDGIFVTDVDNRFLNGKYLINPLKGKLFVKNKALTEESAYPDPAKDDTVFVRPLGKTLELKKGVDDNHLLATFQVESDELKSVKNDKLPDEIAFSDETRSDRKIDNQFVFIRNIGNKELDSKFNDHHLLVHFKLQTDLEHKLHNIKELRDGNSEWDSDGDDSTVEILGIVKNIQHLAKAVKSPQLKVKAFQKVLEALDNIEGLRMGQKEGLEENEENAVAVENNVVNKPYNHQFNYWTYLKELYENECPGEQVKIGNVCSWTPPH